jgi:hypothetical protein
MARKVRFIRVYSRLKKPNLARRLESWEAGMLGSSEV